MKALESVGNFETYIFGSKYEESNETNGSGETQL